MEAVQKLAPYQQQAFMMEIVQLKDSLRFVLSSICRREADAPFLVSMLEINTSHTPPFFRFSSMYNNLVSRCFDTCVTGFRSKTMDKSEISCVESCADRYVKMTQRVGLRFAEHQAMQPKAS
jgi:hypothetical protein